VPPYKVVASGGDSGAQHPISCLAPRLLHTSNIVFENVVSPYDFCPPYCEILVTGLPQSFAPCLVKGLCTTLEPHLNKLWSKSYVFKNKAKIMGKCAIGGSFQLCSCKILQIFVPFVCILCSWICSYIEMWNKFNSFIHVIPQLPFPVAMFWDPFLRACPLILISTSVQVISVSVSNGSVNSLSTCKIKSILHLQYVRFCCWLSSLLKWFQIIYSMIGWQLTSDESWNNELMNSGSSLISWKDWFFTRQQGKGKSFMKTLRLRIIAIEPSQYMSSQINI